MDNRPIGLFDSGVGGLSVLAEIKKILPKENFIFLADQAHVPYGSKSKKQLEKLSERITIFLIKHNIKMLVIACNTATCYALSHLRKNYNIPIVGVVPAIKPAAKLSNNSKIAVMSTPATAKSTYLKSLIQKYANDSKVLNLGCKQLEDSVEELDKKKISTLLDKYVSQVNNFNADVIILGCTHFPFLKNEIKKRSLSNAKIIDSGKSIAKRVKAILNDEKIKAETKVKDLFFTTASPQKFSKVASELLQYKVKGKKVTI